MCDISVTLLTSHAERSWLKAKASLNMCDISVTLLTSHAERSWSNPPLPRNISDILVTWSTFHFPIAGMQSSPVVAVSTPVKASKVQLSTAAFKSVLFVKTRRASQLHGHWKSVVYVSCFQYGQSQCRLKAVAPLNMDSDKRKENIMREERASHFERSWLNDSASLNILTILVTWDTFHFERSWLNDSASLNIMTILVTWDTSHFERSWLNPLFPANKRVILVTLLTIHSPIGGLQSAPV